MPSKQPQLGSLALHNPPSPQMVHISPSTCHDLSLFKEILKEYRRIDDTIGIRLNRANAAARDRQRLNDEVGLANIQNQACENLWRELIENWKRRTQLVNYCVSVVGTSLDEQRKTLEDPAIDEASRRKIQAAAIADKVKQNQVRNELKVESIIRRRSAEAFRARCQYFTPPMTDEQARKMWDAASR